MFLKTSDPGAMWGAAMAAPFFINPGKNPDLIEKEWKKS